MPLPRPKKTKRRLILMAIGAKVAGWLFVFMVILAPVIFIVNAITSIPILGGIVERAIGIDDDKVDEITKDLEKNGTAESLRAQFDCANRPPGDRARGLCRDNLVDSVANGAMPPGRSGLVPVYVAAANRFQVPWEVIAAMHGASTGFGTTNCSTDGKSGGQYMMTREDFTRWAVDEGSSQHTTTEGSEEGESCWEIEYSDPLDGDRTLKIGVRDGRADARDPVDATFAIARMLAYQGARGMSSWRYNGGPANGCAVEPARGDIELQPAPDEPDERVLVKPTLPKEKDEPGVVPGHLFPIKGIARVSAVRGDKSLADVLPQSAKRDKPIVLASISGKLSKPTRTPSGLSVAIVNDEDGMTVRYFNLSRLEEDVKAGDEVMQGNPIAFLRERQPLRVEIEKPSAGVVQAPETLRRWLVDGVGFSSGPVEEEEDTSNDDAGLAKRINAYIAKKFPASPMKDLGKYFVRSARKWKVEPGFLVGIAQGESGFGTAGPEAVPKKNAFGYTCFPGQPGTCTTFPTWQAGIEAAAKNLTDSPYYLPLGNDTIAEINKKWVGTDGPTEWSKSIIQVLTAVSGRGKKWTLDSKVLYGTAGGGSGGINPEDLKWTKVHATRYSPTGSDVNTSSGFRYGANPDVVAYAELSSNQGKAGCNGASVADCDWSALGYMLNGERKPLPNGTVLGVRKGDKLVWAVKIDVGRGGDGSDDPMRAIDLTVKPADELGVSLTPVEVSQSIGTVKVGPRQTTESIRKQVEKLVGQGASGGKYTGPPPTDRISKAIMFRAGKNRDGTYRKRHSYCYVAHIHEWYEAIKRKAPPMPQAAFFGGGSEALGAYIRQKMAAYIGTPYVLGGGGKDPGQPMDCSNFSQNLMRVTFDIPIQGVTWSQWDMASSRNISTHRGNAAANRTPDQNDFAIRGINIEDVRPGDLVFFAPTNEHVGVMIDKGEFQHSGKPNKYSNLREYVKSVQPFYGWLRIKKVAQMAGGLDDDAGGGTGKGTTTLMGVPMAHPLGKANISPGASPEEHMGRIVGPASSFTAQNKGGWPSNWAFDLNAPPGTAVYAPINGKVVYVQDRGAKFPGYPGIHGWTVIIDSNKGLAMALFHITKPSVKVGDTVSIGDKIAEVISWNAPGKRGTPHLHLSAGPSWENQAVNRSKPTSTAFRAALVASQGKMPPK